MQQSGRCYICGNSCSTASTICEDCASKRQTRSSRKAEAVSTSTTSAAERRFPAILLLVLVLLPVLMGSLIFAFWDSLAQLVKSRNSEAAALTTPKPAEDNAPPTGPTKPPATVAHAAAPVTTPKAEAEIAQSPEGIVGDYVSNGDVAVAVEKFFLYPAGEGSFMALRAQIRNDKDEAVVLPKMTVVMVDEDDREFTASRQKAPAAELCNPGCKQELLALFRLPAGGRPASAKFTWPKRNRAFVALGQFTPENQALVAAGEYQAALEALDKFARTEPEVEQLFKNTEKRQRLEKEQGVLAALQDQVDAAAKHAQDCAKALKRAQDKLQSTTEAAQQVKTDIGNFEQQLNATQTWLDGTQSWSKHDLWKNRNDIAAQKAQLKSLNDTLDRAYKKRDTADNDLEKKKTAATAAAAADTKAKADLNALQGKYRTEQDAVKGLQTP